MSLYEVKINPELLTLPCAFQPGGEMAGKLRVQVVRTSL
jgi:hypothetical protein